MLAVWFIVPSSLVSVLSPIPQEGATHTGIGQAYLNSLSLANVLTDIAMSLSRIPQVILNSVKLRREMNHDTPWGGEEVPPSKTFP